MWHLTLPGMILLALMLALLIAGIHMMLRPDTWVGRGPLPARSAGNVRAMGALFAILGGSITAFFTVPIFLI